MQSTIVSRGLLAAISADLSSMVGRQCFDPFARKRFMRQKLICAAGTPFLGQEGR